MLLFRRFGGRDPLAAMAALRREIDGMLGAEIAERRADPREGSLSLDYGDGAGRTANSRRRRESDASASRRDVKVCNPPTTPVSIRYTH